MNKTELLSTYTAEQLAEMVEKLDISSGMMAEAYRILEKEYQSLREDFDIYYKNILPRATQDAYEQIMGKHYTGIRIVTWAEWNNREKNAMNISEIQKCQEEYERILKESPLQRTIDGIAKDILEQKNNAMAMEFTRVICDLLKRYGVCVHCTETKHQNITHNLIEERYGVIFDSVDFSQHDKEFKDKIEDLEHDLKTAREKIQDLASVNMNLQCERNDYKAKAELLEGERMRVKINEIADFLPQEPIKVADMLISATYTRQKGNMEKVLHKAFGNNSDTVTENVYSESELRQIAEHLLVYCSHNEGGEE